MFFPISNAHINPIYLTVVGFVIGILGGFFGVGGSFIAGPALRLMGVNWNYAVGTDLAHIVGKSIVAAKQHRALGNVDLKLGFFMAFGTIGGAECGAQLIQALKRAGNVNTVVSYVAIVVYSGIAAFMLWESRKTLIHALGEPKNAAIGQRPITERAGQGSGVKKRPLRIQPCHAEYSTAENLADDHTAHFRHTNFTLDHPSRRLCWRRLQRFSWRRRRLHSDAVDGVCARDSDASGRGN